MISIRKLEDRKEYFQPQILRIDDEVEPCLSDVEVLEEDEYLFKSGRQTLAEKVRPKSGFKKSFENEQKTSEIEEKSKSKREKSISRLAKLEQEDASNRLKTSDTGYDSLSSSTSSLRSNTLLKNSECKLKTLVHQPKIFSNQSAVSNNSLSNKLISQSGLGSFKNLKTNLAPLPGSKLSK